jgi:hypothetical protein
MDSPLESEHRQNRWATTADRKPALALLAAATIVEPSRPVPSSQVTCNSPRRPWINCRMLLAGFDNASLAERSFASSAHPDQPYIARMRQDHFGPNLLSNRLTQGETFLNGMQSRSGTPGSFVL